MTAKIHILPPDVVLKIAAGEVVERPASVVKELIENSIDAESKHIEVRVRGAGIENIEVIDDGSGIAPEDVANVFKRHATSKITDEADLYRIMSYGFRGEALASIAQVSKIELITRVEECETGKLVYVEGGEIKRCEEIGANKGTKVSVYDLFFNVPVRRKFLRSRQTETGLLTSVFERFAIAHPDRYFKLSIDSRFIFDLQPVNELYERIRVIFGKETAEKLVPFEFRSDAITVSGFASPPEITDIRGSYLYVNKRFIRDHLIQKAIQRGYAEGKERHEPYFVILFLNIPPEEVDVNIHLQKYEVRFKNPGRVFSTVLNAINSAFRKVIPQRLKEKDEKETGVEKDRPEVINETPGIDDRYTRIKESLEEYLLKEGFLRYESRRHEEIEFLLKDVIPLARIFAKYILCEVPDGILLIDQHAAHEILTFYKLSVAYEENSVESQYLLHPEVVELPQGKLRVLIDARDELGKLGFEIDLMGINTLIIRAVPSVLQDENIKSIIVDIADEFENSGTINKSSINKVISTLACHTSVRGGEKLTVEEMRALINDLRNALLSPYCPHGRPVLRFIPLSEIESWFRRK